MGNTGPGVPVVRGGVGVAGNVAIGLPTGTAEAAGERAGVGVPVVDGPRPGVPVFNGSVELIGRVELIGKVEVIGKVRLIGAATGATVSTTATLGVHGPNLSMPTVLSGAVVGV